MRDFTSARKKMVASQLEARGIRDHRVLTAMAEVPRHFFVDESLRDEAYDDNPLPIGEGQTISQPYMVAIMTELLQLLGSEIILEIGTGSGYQAAVLSKLCRWVYTVERIKSLSERAQEITKAGGYENITFIVGDGTEGWPEAAPYDGIIVTAGAPRIPDTFVSQLRLGGKLVIPVGDRFSQTLQRVIKTEQGTTIENHTGCRFVDLIGRWGWVVS
ncbi:MAG TPA: protein-L-isoaspartate(D-aspartate) O-methyltransferase [Desulfomonilaceae bacterium]|nr:protein-L-isoaspartate(D-aspartate) O-methyltransferase [Desulfomonilaceae bacterium]